MELLDFREALEPPIAARAAERATSVDTRRLRKLTEELDAESDPARAADLDARFHHAIALATRNHVLVMLVETSLEVLNQTRRRNLQTPARLEMSRRAHRAILAAIEAGDPDAAGLAMTDHIREVAALVMQADRPTHNDSEIDGRRRCLTRTQSCTEELLAGRVSRGASFAAGPLSASAPRRWPRSLRRAVAAAPVALGRTRHQRRRRWALQPRRRRRQVSSTS